MLASQNVQLPFGIGIDEKVNADLLDPNQGQGGLFNLRIKKTGSYEKRHGYDAAASLSRLQRMGQFRGAPIAFDGTNLQNYSATQNAWTSTGSVSNCVATRSSLVSGSSLHHAYDIAYANGVYGIIYSKFANSFYYWFVVFIDKSTGNIIGQTAQLGTSTGSASPRLRATVAGDTFVFVTGTATSNNLTAYTADSLNIVAGLTTVGVIANDAVLTAASPNDNDVNFEICPTDNTHYAVAYRSTATSTTLRVRRYLTSSTSAAANAVIASPIAILTVGIGCKGSGGATLWAGTSGFNAPNAPIYGVALNPTTLAVTGTIAQVAQMTASDRPMTISIIPKGSFAAFVCGNAPLARDVVWSTAQISGGAVSVQNTGGTIYRYSILGKGVFFSGDIYVPLSLSYGTNVEPTGYVARLANSLTQDIILPEFAYAFPIATFLARIVGNIIADSAPNSSTITADGEFVTLCPQKLESNATALTAITMDFTATNRWQNAELPASMPFSAGTPSSYDGQSPTEIGFLNAPSFVSPADAGAGLLTGTYLYTAIYEWFSAAGEIVQSAPAPIATYVAASKSATVTIAALQMSYKLSSSLTNGLSSPNGFVGDQHPVRIAVYRTTGAAGSDTFYRVPVDLFQSSDGNTGVPSTLSLVDNIPDTTLETQPLLYAQPLTPGAPLAKFCPPSATCMVVHRNRLFLVGDDGTTVYYSGQYVDGEQAWFSDQFTLQVPKGGPITAMASMDGILYIFKRDLIFSVTGDGPADNGTGNDLSVPEEIDTEVGCIEPRSVVLMPGGLFFQSAQGIYLLSRARSASYVGKNVETALSNYPVISSANISDKNGCVYFEAMQTESPTINDPGITLVYDYVHGQWFQDIKKLAGDVQRSSHGAIVIGDKYYWGMLQGNFAIENAGYFDDTQWVTAEIDTAWIKPGGIEGYARMWRFQLLAQKDPADGGTHGIHCSAFRDYNNDMSFQDWDWQASELDALTLPRQQLQMDPRIQKVESLSLQFYDFPPDTGTSTGKGPIWIGYTLEIGIKQGEFKLPSANSK